VFRPSRLVCFSFCSASRNTDTKEPIQAAPAYQHKTNEPPRTCLGHAIHVSCLSICRPVRGQGGIWRRPMR
jgi:hypothetical protein